MYSFGNRWESILNSLNLKKKFDNWLVNYVRENYDPKLDYVSALYKKWNKEALDMFLSILINGVVFWLGIMALINVVPFFSNIFRIGPSYNMHVVSILSLGMVLYAIKGTYKWFRLDYKKRG